MMLSELTQGTPFIPPEWDRVIGNLHLDSRDIKPGDVFIARQGSVQDACQYIGSAIEQGAVAVLAQGDVRFEFIKNAPVFYTPDLHALCPGWLKQYYITADYVELAAVTGTNGKSSVTHFIAQLLHMNQVPVGVFGTLGNGIWPELRQTHNTTSDLSVIRRQLSSLHAQKVKFAAMEVSSHGLQQGRIAGLKFNVGVFTNLSRDHLDYHGNINNYYASKRELFTSYAMNYAVINSDDHYGQILQRDPDVKAHVLTYGNKAGADIRYSNIRYDNYSMQAYVSSPWGKGEINLPMLGEFNLANVLAAISVLAIKGYDFSLLLDQARHLKPVDGRMMIYQREHEGKNQLAIVDFAHTPDALNSVLATLSQQPKPLSVVFGCGGDRDSGKRPLMAESVLYYADKVWLTDDNPRHEDPEKIWADVLSVKGSEAFHCQHDRALAIHDAVHHSLDNILLIAGKGHEHYQEIAGIKHQYSDEQVLMELGFSKVGGQHAG